MLDVVYNHLGPVGNYLGKFGPYFTSNHSTPWGDAVNFEEAGAAEVRRFLIDNALMWLRDYHLDGLRLDAVHSFNDRSAIHFLEQLAGEVRRLEAAMGKHFMLIAESDLNDPRIVKAEEAGGYGLDAQWSDDFHHALFSVNLRRACKAITRTSAHSRIWQSRSVTSLSTTATTLNIVGETTAVRSWVFRVIALWASCRTTIR